MTLKEVAVGIDKHLKRFEADPEINKVRPPKTISPFYQAGAWSSGRYVGVRYVAFQGHTSLTKQEAMDYLGWLDGGHVGKHYLMISEAQQPVLRGEL